MTIWLKTECQIVKQLDMRGSVSLRTDLADKRGVLLCNKVKYKQTLLEFRIKRISYLYTNFKKF